MKQRGGLGEWAEEIVLGLVGVVLYFIGWVQGAYNARIRALRVEREREEREGIAKRRTEPPTDPAAEAERISRIQRERRRLLGSDPDE